MYRSIVSLHSKVFVLAITKQKTADWKSLFSSDPFYASSKSMIEQNWGSVL